MKKRTYTALFAMLVALGIAGCQKKNEAAADVKATPDACANVQSMAPSSERQTLADKCTRSGTFTPSPKKGW